VKRLARAGLAGWTAMWLIVGAALADPGDGDALAQLTRALAAAEQKEGKTSPYLLPVIEEIAQLHQRNGELGEAAALRRRALDIAVTRFGADSPSAAEAMVVLAQIAIDQRRYLDAEPLLVVAESILGERVDADHPAMAAIFAGLARIALARGDTLEATASAERAVAITRRNPHGRSTEPLRVLGAVLASKERFTRARRILGEALAQDREHFGPDGLATARSLAQLANIELRAHRFTEALPLIQQAAAIDQARLGSTHPFIADDLFDLGLVYDGLKRPNEARKAFTSALDVLERGAGRDTPRVAYVEQELARLDRQEGKEAEADASSADARRILNKAEAEEHKRERRV
jgi:tetratricopeptide (TPR) repeat protein